MKIFFAGYTIYYDGVKATSSEGTLAGSTTHIPEIIKKLVNSGILGTDKKEIAKNVTTLIGNPHVYHNVHLDGYIEWDDDWNVVEVHLGE